MVKSVSARLDLIFNALSDSTRRQILRGISRHERSIMQVAKPFAMSLAAVSNHLKVLERAHLIHREKRGSYYYVRLNAKTLKSADQWLQTYRQFWEDRLDSLKYYLEKP
jgi:DNA-binding transcriptional ArsR family regulator